MVEAALSSVHRAGCPEEPPGINPSDYLMVGVAPSSLPCVGGPDHFQGAILAFTSRLSSATVLDYFPKKYPQALSLKVFLKDVKLLKDCPYDLLLCTSFRDFL